MNKKLMILGASGYLGSSLNSYFQNSNYDVISHGYSKKSQLVLDATDYSRVEESLLNYLPSVIINCIGFTDVNGCEAQPEKAYSLNSKVVFNIASCIKKNKLDTYLIQISTDHVYDNSSASLEEEVVLKNYYAFSKLMGDLYARDVSSVVLRTNFFGLNNNCPNTGFTEWIYNSLLSGQSINAFNDILFNPLSLDSLAQYVTKIVDLRPEGVYNLGSAGGISKAEFILSFAKELDLQTSLVSIVSSEDSNHSNVKRPKSMLMNCNKIEKLLDISMPTTHQEVKSVADQYKTSRG